MLLDVAELVEITIVVAIIVLVLSTMLKKVLLPTLLMRKLRLSLSFIQGEPRYSTQMKKANLTLDVANLREKYLVRYFKQ